MFPKTYRLLLLCVIFMLFISGCACGDTGHNEFVIIPDDPADESIISSLIPTFGWHDEESCTPDKFMITVAEIGDSYSNYAMPPGNTSSFTWPTSLDPGSQYKWRMRATADNGPTGPYTKENIFYTGPMCSGEVLIAPELVSPVAADWISHNDMQRFKWSYPGGCLPAAYDYEFATDAAFTNVVDSGSTPDYQMWVEKTFPNCSTIFWRVRANDGTSTGPWSSAYDFHWVRDDTCYQWDYLSDDFAWLHIRLAQDYCDQTGYIAAWTQTLNSGCMVDGMIIVGDNSAVIDLKNFVVDLGAGPCPSIGLDQKTANWEAKFGVLTPGTYCVSISRNQSIGWNNDIDLMEGVWTNPRTNAVVAEQTLELGPGLQDLILQFNWDETDRIFLTFPLDFTYDCKIGPEKLCPTYDFAREGETIPILGRDTNSDWKLTQLNGIPCYILLGNAAINEKLGKFEGFDWRAEDLEFFPQPPPCPTPEPVRSCASYNTSAACYAAGCTWYQPVTGAPSYCK